MFLVIFFIINYHQHSHNYHQNYHLTFIIIIAMVLDSVIRSLTLFLSAKKDHITSTARARGAMPIYHKFSADSFL